MFCDRGVPAGSRLPGAVAHGDRVAVDEDGHGDIGRAVPDAQVATLRHHERARVEVSTAMADRFDLRAFHDEVLGHGSLPLATLRREILGWVEAAVTRD